MKRILILFLCVFLVGCGKDVVSRYEYDNVDDIEQDIILQDDMLEENVEEAIELTESEYKKLCQEMYYDDFFENTPSVGQYVKIYGFTSQKYKYSSSDMEGILVKDITDKYNLEWNCLGCCVMHEETKDSIVPSYFGKSLYLMFVKDGKYNLDSFSIGEYIIVYGEIIQNTNGIYILPKYIEEK